jgi:hypothetical protein
MAGEGNIFGSFYGILAKCPTLLCEGSKLGKLCLVDILIFYSINDIKNPRMSYNYGVCADQEVNV